MKRFIKKVFLLGAFFVMATGMIFLIRVIATKSISWNLPGEIHTVFLGASHFEKGIDDLMYPGSINLAYKSERYLFTFLKLKKLLNSNPQIDTVFLQFAPTDIWEHTDSKYYSENEMSYFLPLYYPMFTWEEWKVYLKNIDNRRIADLLFKKTVKFNHFPRNLNSFGGYDPLFNVYDRGNKPYLLQDWTENGNTINYTYLRNIMDLCQTRGVQLFFVYMPMFNKNDFYPIDKYYAAYSDNFSWVPLLDYSDWDCPDRYRADEHHLNAEGAKYFTVHLFQEMKNME
jgi:hypothetical protein